ncbi:MAG: CDP-diacylglycerol--glycerol-3-phosphate 3-phosphatidyltransferase [Methylophilaceae bacterium]
MHWNAPNMLTAARIAMIPVFVGLFYLPAGIMPLERANLLATIVFVLAAITDWLDGYLARRLNQTSNFGAFLDPVADKLMVAAALVVLVDFERVNAVIAFIIIGREIAISALREWMAGVGAGGKVAVATIGKIKTIAQMVAIPFLLFYQPLFGFNVAQIGTYLMIVAAMLTLISMVYYLRAAKSQLRA